MRISVFGTGYVGLVTGTCFAEMGNDVICVDIDPHKISLLEQGVSPIYEPGLDHLISSNHKTGRLQFTTDSKKAIRESDILFIAVGTPPGEDGSADLSHVLKVAETIGEYSDTNKVVVNKSTVPVGTAKKVKEVLENQMRIRGKQISFDVVSNPEFLKEGTAIEDCLRPSRVVIGCESEKAANLLKALYEPFLRNNNPLYVMDPISSEMTKYAANALLATKISFINELSRLSEKVGADIGKIRQGIGSDPRIGFSFIYAGLGYGGSCFPKDVTALIRTAQENDEEFEILKAVVETNQLQRKRFFQKIEKHFDGQLRGKKFAIWGLSFKPLTDDIREAPSLDLIEGLSGAGAQISAHDPVAIPNTKKVLKDRPHITFEENVYSTLLDADALCIVTEWMPFREPDFDKIKGLMKTPIIFDGRNLYDTHFIRDLGFTYYSIGRP